MLRAMGYSPDATTIGGNYSDGLFNGFYKQSVDGQRVSENGGAGVNLPVAGGVLGFNANTQRDPGELDRSGC